VLGLFATYTASIGNVLSARNSRDGIGVLESNAIGMAIGALSAFAFAMFYQVPLQFDFSPGYVISLLYLAIFGSVIAFGTYLTLMARIGADRAAYAAVLFPVVALAISTVFENYQWTWEAFVGIALILIGNILALAPGEKLRKLLILFKQNPAQNPRR
jgi:drug/metabolite transporter (DMT)-like permease